MIVTLGAIIVAIWMLAIYGTIQEEHEMKYDVTVRPGAVSYGTHSSATIPMVSAPSHTSAPMISGRTIRSYAHYGHASYAHNPSPVTAIHTTSSATVHTIGSGNGGGGGTSSSAAGGKGGSRGIAYSGGSVSMPSLALATTSFASSSDANTQETGRMSSGPRKVHSDGYGGYEGDYNGEPYGGQYWNEEDGEWVDDLFDGALKYEGGKIWKYEGGEWKFLEDQADPGAPLGDAPWHWILLLAFGYAIVRMIRTKHNTI